MVFRLSCSYVSKAHTILASTAFLSALFLGLRLHYRRIVKNEVAGYPEEWWPSVSATIGDWYPERSVFQIFIALTAGPRIVLVFCWWLLTKSTSSNIPHVVAISGLARTLSCGGWVYITSSDDHGTHDIFMVFYMVLNLPWMIGSILCTPVANTKSRNRRKLIASSFFLAVIPMVYLFIQHKVHRVPGAYTKYSFCEWYLIFSDIWFDSVTAGDFTALEISITEPSAAARDKISSETTKSQFVPVASPKIDSAGDPHMRIKPSQDEQNVKDHQTHVQSYPQGFFNPCSPLTKYWRPVAAFLADVYLAYIWWSIFTSLAITLFYFSVWRLAIAGQEFCLISTLAPIFLGFPAVLQALSCRKGRTWLHVVSTIGLVAYKVEDPLIRLIAVAFANIAGVLLKAVEWRDEDQTTRNGLVLALGLAVSSLSKLMNHSNNPVWPIVNEKSGGWNKTGILLAFLAIWEYATRDLSQKVVPSPGSRTRVPAEGTKKMNTPSVIAKTSDIWDHWLFSSMGLGALIFSLHCFLADSGTLVAWSWTGYPVKGPIPSYHGHFTLMAIAIGIIISSSAVEPIVRHPLWMTFGVISTTFLYRWRDWPGYSAGLCLAIFLSSIIPTIIQSAARHGKDSPGRVYFTAWLVVCLFDLANVWTVAYAFVPAGWILRERTDIVLLMQLTAIGFGLAPEWRRMSSIPTPISELVYRKHARRLAILIMFTAFLWTGYWLPNKTPLPHKPSHRLITAGIWTVHFGIDNSGRDSQRRMRDLIQDMQLDVVGLLETDLHRVVFGNRDLTQVIARDLGYYVDIGPGPNSHTWGAVLLSKFPIITSTHHLLPSPRGELAPAISAVLNVWGQNVTVVVSHNGQEEDPVDRELQSTELAHIMAATHPGPVIFLGYVVSKPLAERPDPYEILVTDGMMYDIDDEDWDRWCEYILYRGLYRVSYARVSRSTVTDTELQVGKFILPKFGHPVVNASREDRYLRTYRELLPGALWFNDEYLGNPDEGGKNGHFYHVHPWPLYYKLPENAFV